MLKLSELKLSKITDARYKDVKFKLHYIADISTKPGENRYHAIFRSIKARTDFDLTEEIPPELLSYYVIGTFYRNGKRLPNEYLGLEPIKFPLADGEILKIKEINEITKHKIPADAKKYIKLIENQYAYFGRIDGYSVIIPCHVIGSAFYFTSTTMRKRIFDSKIESLYYKTGFDDIKGYPYIILKTGVPDSDAAFAYFYAVNKEARLKWHSIKNNLYLEKKALDDKKAFSGFVPLKIDFHIEGKFEIFAITLKDEASKRIFVYKILNAESLVYNYDKIIIRRYSKDTNKEFDETTRDIMQNPIYRTKTKKTGIISNEAPSYRNSIKIIEDDGEDDFFGIEKIKEIINKDDNELDKEKGNINFVSGKEAKDLSFSQLRDVRNSNTRPAETKKAEQDYFSLDDFKELAKTFKEKYDEFIEKDCFIISEPTKLPVRKGKKRLNIKESYDGRNLRKYITARFVFTGGEAHKNVLLIELDQKYSGKGFSTYILIGENIITAAQKTDFLRRYLLNMNLDNIENYLSTQDIGLVRKKHPDKSYKGKSFERWCKDLYKKIITTKI